ncbi:hypothetical protein RI054_05g29580 [Pseudoscourfieldia marina]
MRQIAPSTSEKMKGGKRKAQEENRTPKPKISPHAALATAVAAEAQHRAQFARRITSANRPQAVITCTTISRNLLARAARGQRRDVSLGRLELYDNRGNTYPIKIVDNFFASRWHRHSTST